MLLSGFLPLNQINNFNFMQIKPIGNRVVIEITKQNQTSASGIIIATEPKNEQQKGIVISVGNGYGDEKELTNSIKVGQTVLFGKYGGDDYKDEVKDKDYKIVNSKDVIAIID
jgi:chaperonin GroES